MCHGDVSGDAPGVSGVLVQPARTYTSVVILVSTITHQHDIQETFMGQGEHIIATGGILGLK